MDSDGGLRQYCNKEAYGQHKNLAILRRVTDKNALQKEFHLDLCPKKTIIALG